MNDKIEPVAWRYKTDNGWVVTKTMTCSASEPLYPATTVSALEARIAQLEGDSAYLKALLPAIQAFKGKRGAFMALGAQDARTVRLWEVLEGRAP